MILIDAVYINQSGGKILLELLIKVIIQRKMQGSFFFLLDRRFQSHHLSKLDMRQFLFLAPSESSRRKFYKRLPEDIKTILCFANVPPPVHVAVKKVYIFFQNSLILQSKGMQYDFLTRFIFFSKRIYIRFLNKKEYKWIVQTPNMQGMLIDRLSITKHNVLIIPFFQEDRIKRVNQQLHQNVNNFLYVADGTCQKNHSNLLKAWRIINQLSGRKLELNLTVPEKYDKLLNEIDTLKNDGSSIINHGFCSKDKLTDLYKNCNYFIFPSLTESFGLPLIEAASAGCEIISSDLPYVHDVITPLKTFNPNEVSSIVEAVLNVIENPHERNTEIRIQNKINSLLDLIIEYNV